MNRAALAFALALGLALGGPSGCSSKPSMKLNHAEVSGVELALPLKVGVLLNVYIDVYNPNSYDVAVRKVQGTTTLADRHTIPVDFNPGGDGVWLPSKKTTTITVPVSVPVQTGLAVLNEASGAPSIAYRFTGKANVTATRTFQVEKDDYSIDERGEIQRAQLEATVKSLPIPGL